jgi:hypothetical protein
LGRKLQQRSPTKFPQRAHGSIPGRGFKDEKPPTYPEAGSAEQRREYWAWFDKYFSATKAMIAAENAANKRGRIRWVDYRLPISRTGDTLHLHLCPAGKYDTGVFAYNFI